MPFKVCETLHLYALLCIEFIGSQAKAIIVQSKSVELLDGTEAPIERTAVGRFPESWPRVDKQEGVDSSRHLQDSGFEENGPSATLSNMGRIYY